VIAVDDGLKDVVRRVEPSETIQPQVHIVYHVRDIRVQLQPRRYHHLYICVSLFFLKQKNQIFFLLIVENEELSKVEIKFLKFKTQLNSTQIQLNSTQLLLLLLFCFQL